MSGRRTHIRFASARLRAALILALAGACAAAGTGGVLLAGGAGSGRGIASLADGPASRAHAGPVIPPGRGALVAILRQPTVLRAAPDGRRLGTLGVRTAFGSETALLVRRVRHGWLGVVSVLAGNRRLGWIPLSSAAFARVDYRIDVSLAARRLQVLEGGRVIARFAVTIGMPGAPTPTGYFAVTDRLRTTDPATNPYGCCILALSASAPHAIQGWGGGTRIAIHSTLDPASVGQAASHGCVRVTIAEGRWLLARIPIGTPVVISSA
jgi:lipoprotein-anchoring transpeptidase ErfK/SrfK